MKNSLKQVIPEPVKRLVKRWATLITYHWKIRRATPVFVYQMGKVGSLSIYQSLSKQYRGLVLHSHRFSPKHRDPMIRRLYDWSVVKARPINIISLTREPIGRNVSAFFQTFERATGIPYAEASFTIDELKAIFLSNHAHELPLEWFDKNILANFSIDVFSTAFPESGLCTYSYNNVRLLVIRLEISDADKVTAIKEFLGLDFFQIYNCHSGEEKNYSTAYKNFKSKVKFPPDYIDRMCGSKYFNHFYSNETINAVAMKWRDK